MHGSYGVALFSLNLQKWATNWNRQPQYSISWQDSEKAWTNLFLHIIKSHDLKDTLSCCPKKRSTYQICIYIHHMIIMVWSSHPHLLVFIVPSFVAPRRCAANWTMTWWYISFKMTPVGHRKQLKNNMSFNLQKTWTSADRSDVVLKFGSNVGSLASWFLTPPPRFPSLIGELGKTNTWPATFLCWSFFQCFAFLMNSCLNGGLKDFIVFLFASIIAEDESHVWWTDMFQMVWSSVCEMSFLVSNSEPWKSPSTNCTRQFVTGIQVGFNTPLEQHPGATFTTRLQIERLPHHSWPSCGIAWGVRQTNP